ncbi:hypothetical protein CLU95_4065 [Variovorax sp. 54]|uniref:hypothetical protein n=1 Tax=Variovorax sp. 54 TaxID=2035212 RepID=UPI000C174E56|nr:hypothetical protein [Variovorax sp. 54]PIF76896.1 hypothetical protein CLU95_4065 [Variovorax sp. 54]
MTAHHKAPHQSFWRMWGWPIVLGVLTTIGLITALFSDGGIGDMVAWVGLGIPVLVCAWYGWRRSPRTGSR